MGFLGKLFGGGSSSRKSAARGRFVQCGSCGKPVQPMTQNMSIVTATPDDWSIEGMAGYCPQCMKYLCSDHLFMRNTTGQAGGPYEISCKQHSVSVRGGP
jgi:hypothetical protein